MKTVFIIKTKYNTQFGPYPSQEAAKEARYNLKTHGDSIGFKWPYQTTRIAECHEWQDHRGVVVYEELI